MLPFSFEAGTPPGTCVPPSGFCTLSMVSAASPVVGLLHPTAGPGVRRVSDCTGNRVPVRRQAGTDASIDSGFHGSFPATRITPFEEFPFPTAALCHHSRCLLAVLTTSRRCSVGKSVMSSRRCQRWTPYPSMGFVPLQGPSLFESGSCVSLSTMFPPASRREQAPFHTWPMNRRSGYPSEEGRRSRSFSAPGEAERNRTLEKSIRQVGEDSRWGVSPSEEGDPGFPPVGIPSRVRRNQDEPVFLDVDRSRVQNAPALRWRVSAPEVCPELELVAERSLDCSGGVDRPSWGF